MSIFKVIYADASEELLHFEGEAEHLFEQLFSACSDEVRELCSVIKHKAEESTPDTPDES